MSFPMTGRNAVKEAASSRRSIRGVHMTFAAPAAIEVLANAGIEFVYLDGEHGCFDWRDIENGCLAAERHALTTIARVPTGRLRPSRASSTAASAASSHPTWNRSPRHAG
jgi:2-keto-3-deoxy-L-rhamnonate aldolase RhmA